MRSGPRARWWVIIRGPRRRAAAGAWALGIALTFAHTQADADAPGTEALLARARTLELPTPYEPPPGNALEHHAAGFAQIMCSAVFITHLDAAFAAENVGFFTAPYEERGKLGAPVIDRVARTVSVAVPGGRTRVAQYLGDQGCVTRAAGENGLHFTPESVPSRLGDPNQMDWPMGDRTPAGLPPGLDAQRVEQAVDAAFATPASMTAAFIATWHGRIIAERYAPGIDRRTPLESWSMGKSVTATLMGVLLARGDYTLMQPAPIPEWQGSKDPRAAIRIADLLHMSSGLRIRAPFDPGYDPHGPYPDHLYLYTGGVNAFHYAATRPLEWPPNTVGRYRNTDPVLVNYLIRLAVERRHEDYLAFPRRALFDRLGMRSFVIETDPFGNYLLQGYDLAAARDWARLGNLYLADGVWNGERILPKDFVRFVRTPAPAWVADGRPIYGGFFWLNADHAFAAPAEAYYMSGAGGQTTLIDPAHDLVVVRLGHFRGEKPGEADLNRALTLLIAALPPRG
jgi:CubicO group peptidase (beta-lactamase class C family)